MRPRIVYLHGFNSSPQSVKARLLGEHLQSRGLDARYTCPALPALPNAALEVIEAEIGRVRGAPLTLVGSSLGGFYATRMAEKHGCRAVLINPAITPHVGLRAYLGPQQNLYTGERYELTQEHLRQWEELFTPEITPPRYLLMVETGDEVLDYRDAVSRYAGAQQLVVQGGDHQFRSLERHISTLLGFARLEV